jgi:hypothetical protein
LLCKKLVVSVAFVKCGGTGGPTGSNDKGPAGINPPIGGRIESRRVAQPMTDPRNVLRKLTRRSPLERRLLFQALVLVPAARLALWFLPFRVVHRLLRTRSRRGAADAGVPPDRIAWAVTAAAARVPQATCLTQALAATALLERYGHEATLRFGVAKDERGGLRAHAWVDSGGQTVIGEARAGEFEAFPAR